MNCLLIHKKLKESNLTTIAGSISFFIILNCGSLFFLISTLLKLLNLNIYEYTKTYNDIFTYFLNFFSTNVLYLNVSNIILTFTSIWSSSSLFYHIIQAGEVIYHKKRNNGILYKRGFSIVLVFLFIILIVITIMLIILGYYFIRLIKNELLYSFISTLLMFIIPSFIIVFFLLFVPPINIKLKEISKGYLFTIISWVICTFLFKLYLKIFTNFKALYGMLTLLVVFMLYLYILIICLMIGMIINQLNKFQNKEVYLN